MFKSKWSILTGFPEREVMRNKILCSSYICEYNSDGTCKKKQISIDENMKCILYIHKDEARKLYYKACERARECQEY